MQGNQELDLVPCHHNFLNQSNLNDVLAYLSHNKVANLVTCTPTFTSSISVSTALSMFVWTDPSQSPWLYSFPGNTNCGAEKRPEKHLKPSKKLLLRIDVVDPDPVGSVSFCRIRLCEQDAPIRIRYFIYL
jgi:hypothetical protein